MATQLNPIQFSAISRWVDDDQLSAFNSFLLSAERMVKNPYKTRGLGIDSSDLVVIARAALELAKTEMTTQLARAFFEVAFQPHRVVGETGFLTGYYEPVVGASQTRSAEFSEPLYLRPPDLIDVTAENRPVGMDADIRYGRKTKSSIEEYYDREAIGHGALSGQGLELVYLKNKVDMFFIHVQGSAKLELDTGDLMRVTYAAKSGHAYTSIAKTLCARLGVPPAEMTADRLMEWMHSNPNDLDELLFNNRSFIFFEEVKDTDPNSGPIAAAKTPLVAGRSLAVDRTLHTFGTPIWVTTKDPLPEDSTSLDRLMIAHDTGSAIVGAARGDIFVGSGHKAGFRAGRVRHDAEMIVFKPAKNFSLNSLKTL